MNKSGFKGVVLGLSGGIDSALVAALAVDALGPDRVRCVMSILCINAARIVWGSEPLRFPELFATTAYAFGEIGRAHV